jgi:hypothetical protein
VHENVLHALCLLGGTIVSEWHGQGVVYGGSEVAASRGIGHGCAGELDGEVTGWEVVGASLAHVGVHCRHGIDPGMSEGYQLGLCSLGSRKRSAGTAQANWGLAVVAVSKGKRGEGVLAGHRPRASPSPRVQLDTTRG